MTTLSEKCYKIIESKILSGDYKPGERLRTQALQESLGMGLSPIREALSKLVSTGLVSLEGNKGFSVVRITQRNIRDLCHTYAMIESLALRQAILKGDDEWEANIAAKLYLLSKVELSGEKVSWAEWQPVNTAFHRALVEGCGSDSLLEIRELLLNRLHAYNRVIYDLPGWANTNHQEHRELAEAVLARDADKACKILDEHIIGHLEERIEKLHLPLE